MAIALTRFAAAFALSGAMLATPVLAAEPVDPAPSIAVRTNDLDLASETGARILDRRIQHAAMAVCPDYDSRDLSAMAAIHACRATALATGRARAQIALARARDGKALAANGARMPTPGD